MKNSILVFSILYAIFTFGFAYAENTLSLKNDASKIVDGQVVLEDLLLDDHLILTFVSHPKSFEHFRESQKKRQELAFICKDKINQLKRDFPNNYQVAIFEKRLEMAFGGFNEPLPYEEIFAPLLVYGIADTSSIVDQAILRDVQAIQVKIFKNWLTRFHIESEDSNFLTEMRDYAKRSPLDMFSKIIGPILDEIEDYDDIIDHYTCDDCEEYDGNNSETECNVIRVEIGDDFLKEVIHSIESSWKESLDVSDFNEVANSNEDISVGQSIEAIAQEIELLFTQIDENYFYRNAIINLFLKANNLL